MDTWKVVTPDNHVCAFYNHVEIYGILCDTFWWLQLMFFNVNVQPDFQGVSGVAMFFPLEEWTTTLVILCNVHDYVGPVCSRRLCKCVFGVQSLIVPPP